MTFGKRFLIMITGIIGMGVFLSFLIGVDYGTDTSSFMNLALSNRLGISLGTCMVLTNAIFFIPEVIFERKLIGIGTIANMTLIGYTSDFCRYLETKYLPDEMFTVQPYRTMTFVIALIPFLISVALYMNADMGLAPYDSIPIILHKRLSLPFAPLRICWDFLIILVGVLAGRHLTIATVLLAILIGPSVSLIDGLLFHRKDTKKLTLGGTHRKKVAI